MLVYASVGDQSEIKMSIMASAVNYAKQRQARENIEKHATSATCSNCGWQAREKPVPSAGKHEPPDDKRVKIRNQWEVAGHDKG